MLRKSFLHIPGVGARTEQKLWQAHLDGAPGALESLLCYNAHDAVNLRRLLQVAYNLAVARMPLQVEPLEIEPAPPIKFQPNGRLIRSLL